MEPTEQQHLQTEEEETQYQTLDPRLHLETLSMKIMNRTSQKGQPCSAHTGTGQPLTDGLVAHTSERPSEGI